MATGPNLEISEEGDQNLVKRLVALTVGFCLWIGNIPCHSVPFPSGLGSQLYAQQPGQRRQPAQVRPALQIEGFCPEASGKSLPVSASGSGPSPATVHHLQVAQEASYIPSRAEETASTA